MRIVTEDDAARRPIAVIGAGTLGWQIAAVFAGHGAEVRLCDIDPQQIDRALDQIEAVWDAIDGRLGDRQLTGTTDLAEAVANAWLVIEAVPERADLKRRLFGDLDRLAPPDALLATNSSSYKSSELIERVARPERVLNLHFYNQPWERAAVEVMTCGHTDPVALELAMRVLPRYGLTPFLARVESTGFIYNRVWAAIKREALLVAAEGVATPAEIDAIWKVVNRAERGPFELMDMVGLDVVLDIENHYAAERDGIPSGPRELLRRHVDAGTLGVKTGEGFYRYPSVPAD